MATFRPGHNDENESRDPLPPPRLGFARWEDLEDRASQAAATRGQPQPDDRARESERRVAAGDSANAVSWELDDGGVQFGRPGPYAGRGPLGYQRSDSRIREDVCERLTDAGDVDATSIVVAVEGGVVTLTGAARDRAARRRAEDIAGDVRGVIDVLNRLRVA